MSAEDTVSRLGEQILEDLGEERTNGMLTRWLAHHTARLMAEADAADTNGDLDAPQRAAEARTAILQLWEHRSVWPKGWPPPRAAKIVRLLDELPEPGEPSWLRGGILARLQDLHHHILAALVDLVAAADIDHAEEYWLAEFAAQLNNDERAVLARTSGADVRTSRLIGWSRRLAGEDCVSQDSEEDDSELVEATMSVQNLAEALEQLVAMYQETALAAFNPHVTNQGVFDTPGHLRHERQSPRGLPE